MTAVAIQSVDDYIACQPPAVRGILERVRSAIRKGTVRFPLSEPVPVKLIGRIAKFRAREVEP